MSIWHGTDVDLRGKLVERLEERLNQLETTNRTVIAAAYENLAGTNQVHRAILRMLDPVDFETFLRDLGGEVATVVLPMLGHMEPGPCRVGPAFQGDGVPGTLRLVSSAHARQHPGSIHGDGLVERRLPRLQQSLQRGVEAGQRFRVARGGRGGKGLAA